MWSRLDLRFKALEVLPFRATANFFVVWKLSEEEETEDLLTHDSHFPQPGIRSSTMGHPCSIV